MNARRAAVPAPEAPTASTALDTLTGGDRPQVVVQFVEVAALRPHPRNPRRDLGDLTELVDSIRAHGVRQNLLVVPDPDEPDAYRLVIGHRRAAGAAAAGLARVPAAIDPALTDADQLELMLLENLQRADLSPVEEADGYQGLLDLGLDVVAIAATTGRSATTVRSRLKLVTLPEKAREAVHTHTATLEDAAALAEFDGDPAARDRLATVLGTADFAMKLRKEREAAARVAAFAPHLDRLTAANVTKLAKVRNSWENADPPQGLARATQLGQWDVRSPERVEAFAAEVAKACTEAGWAWRYYTDAYSAALALFRPHTVEEADAAATRDEAATAREQEAEQHRARVAEQQALAAAASELRAEFLRSRIARAVSGKHAAAVHAFVADQLVYETWNGDGSLLVGEPAQLLSWLGVDEAAVIAQAEADGIDSMDAVEQEMLKAAAAMSPEQRMLAVAAAGTEPIVWHQLRARQSRAWYALLGVLGYEASSDELAAIAEQG